MPDPDTNQGQGKGDTKETFSYTNLCKEHFRSANPLPQFSRKEPRSPLLKSTSDEDLELILRVWKMMMRFMNDVTDNKSATKTSKSKSGRQKPNIMVMRRLTEELTPTRNSNTGSGRGESLEGQASATGSEESSETGSSKKLKQTLKKRLSRVPSGVPREDVEVINVEELQTGFEQMQFIIGVGIIRHNLRDEIYCQLMRMLTNNSVKTGRARLWALLNLMVGVYAPSDRILPFVARFIDDGSSSVHSSSAKKLLVRIQRNGPRFQPASKMEYLAILNRRPIDLEVTLMDGTNRSVSSDSCTTSAEVIQFVAQEIEMEETFGFSLFIAMENKISSLGGTGDKVLDSISQCEQLHQANFPESRPEDAPWRLFIRKEMFSPWDDVTGNHISTNLVYLQIVRGIMLGEYICDRDNDLAALAAMQYYIEYESDVSEDNLYSALPYYVPSHKLAGEDSIRVWCKQVGKLLNRMIPFYRKSDDNNGMTPDDIKAELVSWSKRKWPKAFSRYFDVRRLEGPRWSSDSLILGVNSSGIGVSTVKGDMGMDATYPQISSITGESRDPGAKSISGSVFVLVFADGTLMKCESVDANEIYRLITSNMAGLLERSTWAVAKQEFYDPSNKYLSCIEGDLIQLSCPAKEEALSSVDCDCTNMATDEEGKIKTDLLHILPCVEEPTDHILRLFRSPKYYTKRAAIEQHKQETSAEVYDPKMVGGQLTVQLQNSYDDEDDDEPSSPTVDSFARDAQLDDDDEAAISVASPTELASKDGEVSSSKVETKRTNDENWNDSESSNIGFDGEFYSAMTQFQKEVDASDDQADSDRKVPSSDA